MGIMGIYNSGKIKIKPKKEHFFLLAGLIVLAIIIFSLLSLNPTNNPISYNFEKNPIKQEETTQVIISIRNNSEQDAENVPLSLKAKEQSEFDIYPMNEKFDGHIRVLSAGTSREITFLINPIQKVLPGTYTLVAETTINNQQYSKEFPLTITNDQ